MKVTDVKALDNYQMSVVFDDGVSGIVSLSDLITKGIFQSLSDKNAFSKVYTDGYAIAWSDELEIDAKNIYFEITHNKPADYLKHSYHAAN